MPRGSPSVVAATAICLVGIVLALVGALVLARHDKGLGLGLLVGGIVVVFVSSWISTLGRRSGDGARPSRRA